MTCEFATLDAAYVLGSLAPAERTDYERHLASCDACSRSVRELAGLPGLLARVPADVLEPSADREPVPATLLPGLVAAAERYQRRRTTRAALLAAAAAVLVAGGSTAAVASLGNDDAVPLTMPSASVATTTAEPVRLTSVGQGGSTGWLSLTPVSWGTRLDLTCTYASQYGGDEARKYFMVIRTTDGLVEQVASWTAVPGRERQISAETATEPDAIASVEIQNSDGDAILRLRQ